MRKTGQKEQTPSLKITKVPLHLHTSWESYYLEILMIAGLVVYFANFVIGRVKNQRLATAWFNAHKQMLDANFSLVGESYFCSFLSRSYMLNSIFTNSIIAIEN